MQTISLNDSSGQNTLLMDIALCRPQGHMKHALLMVSDKWAQATPGQIIADDRNTHVRHYTTGLETQYER